MERKKSTNADLASTKKRRSTEYEKRRSRADTADSSDSVAFGRVKRESSSTFYVDSDDNVDIYREPTTYYSFAAGGGDGVGGGVDGGGGLQMDEDHYNANKRHGAERRQGRSAERERILLSAKVQTVKPISLHGMAENCYPMIRKLLFDPSSFHHGLKKYEIDAFNFLDKHKPPFHELRSE